VGVTARVLCVGVGVTARVLCVGVGVGVTARVLCVGVGVTARVLCVWKLQHVFCVCGSYSTCFVCGCVCVV
jgi:hypothetical protein